MSTNVSFREIDETLRLLRKSKDKPSAQPEIDALIDAAWTYLGFNPNSRRTNIVIDEGMTDSQKEFIAACCLRALSANRDAIWKPVSLRNSVFTLFDDTLSTYYKAWHIDSRADTNKKASRLGDIEPDILKTFDDLTATIRGVDSASRIRDRFMQALHRREHAILIDKFIPSPLRSNETLCDLFVSLVAYQDAPSNAVLDAYKEAEEAFQGFLAASENYDLSELTIKCVVQPVKRIFEALQKDFESHESLQPASVSVSALPYKYPLHLPADTPVDVRLLVENDGPGIAFAATIEIGIGVTNGITVNDDARFLSLGDLPAGRAERILRAATDGSETDPAELMGYIRWEDAQGTSNCDVFYLRIQGQRTDLNWEQLAYSRPYSTEAVRQESQLFGRTDLVETLEAMLRSGESAILFGQKRVGKTSVARVVESKLQHDGVTDVIFLNIGECREPTGLECIRSLGDLIARRMTRLPAARGLDRPSFVSSLSPLGAYIEDVVSQSVNRHLVFIIDEFDDIPRELYSGTELSETFFHNLRNLSEREQVAFLLVGGENMPVIQARTDKLNLFKVRRVDYLDREDRWDAFTDLVRRPAADVLEFDEAAVERLYAATQGNPFYTKLICDELYKRACRARNAFVGPADMEPAVQCVVRTLDTNNVNHFWIDQNLETTQERRDQVEEYRRRLLIAYADVRRQEQQVSREALLSNKLVRNTGNVEEIIESFVARRILMDTRDSLRWKPDLFGRWLTERGGDDLARSLVDADVLAAVENEEARLYVRDEEIDNLLESWGRPLYRGMRVELGHVRMWLDQFGSNAERRLMLQLLKHLNFYTEARMRECLRLIHQAVPVPRRGGVRERRKDIIVSGFGGPAKSWATVARKYATENQIRSDNVATLNGLPRVLQGDKVLTTLVLVDDIIGSGGTALEGLQILDAKAGDRLLERDIFVLVAAICAEEDGLEQVRDFCENLKFKAEVYACDIIGKSDKVFSEDSHVFDTPDDRRRARQIAQEYGQKIQPQAPLGFADGQLLVVFSDNCPNNSLPILWSNGRSGNQWKPLFERTSIGMSGADGE